MSGGELPEGWGEFEVGHFCDVALGKMLDREKRKRGTSLPYLRNANVQWGEIRTDDLLEMPFEDDELERFALRKGDLMVCEGGEPGRCAVWPGGPEHIKYQKALLRVRPRGGVSSDWVKFSLQRAAISGELESHFTGSTIKHLPQQSLLRYRTLLPPLAEQHRIVAKVDALLAEVNRVKGRLERVRVILRRFRQSVLATACSGKMTEEWRARTSPEPIATAVKRVKFEQTASGREATDNVIPGLCVLSVGDPSQTCPEGWAWLPLMTVARLESGHTPSRNHPEYWDGDIPWISLPDAREHHGKTIDKTTSTISDAGIKNSAARLLPRGTICLSRTASVGYVIQLGKPMATSQDFVNWVCSVRERAKARKPEQPVLNG